MEIHERRSPQERIADEAKQAEDITTDVETWASDPDSFDYPGVDTVPLGVAAGTVGERRDAIPAFDDLAMDLSDDVDVTPFGDVTDPGAEPLVLDQDDDFDELP